MNFGFCQADKITLTFQDLVIDTHSPAFEFKQTLYDAVHNKIISGNRFLVVDRSPEMWRKIEQELALQDFIAPETAIRLGNMVGAKFLITLNVPTFTYERVITKNTDNTLDYHVTCSITISLKLLNLETGIYHNAIESAVTTNHPDRNTAINQAIKNIAAELNNELAKKFPIKASVVKVAQPDLVTINKGSIDGVINQRVFNITSIQSETTVPSPQIKIISSSESESIGKLLSGNIKQIEKNYEVIESFESASNVVMIEKKEHRNVKLNGGKNIGIKSGDIFIHETDQSLSSRNRKPASRIYITDVSTASSTGKILYGQNDIQEQQTLTESKENIQHRSLFLRAQYRSLINFSAKQTPNTGPVDVTNSSGEYLVDTNYLNDFETLNAATIYSIGLGWKNLVTDFSTTINVDFYQLDYLKNWIGYLEINYEYPLLYEKLFLTAGGSLGYGRMKQDIPENTVSTISNGYSSDVRANSPFLAATCGISWQINRIILSGRVAYNYLTYNKWFYDISIDDEDKRTQAPEEIIPYANVNLSGIGYGLSLLYILRY